MPQNRSLNVNDEQDKLLPRKQNEVSLLELSSDSSQNMNKKKPKKKGGCICPICLEAIIEPTKTKLGHDAIFCDGFCDSWLHRKCAGLSKPLFTTWIKSSDSYFCPHCQLRNVTAEVSKLKEVIDSLNKTITTLQLSDRPNEVHPVSIPVSKDDQPKATAMDASERPQSGLKNQASTSVNSIDKKFNVVMYGIGESLPNTSKAERQLRDLENITSAFCNAALPIEASSIRDCFRLGKYKPHAPRPRPILIKFLRSTEATMALSKVGLFKAPINIKPDLTREERDIESFLLKERWSLIQIGFERHRIKIRNKSIFIDNKLYGQFHNSTPSLSVQPTTFTPTCTESAIK